MSGSIIQIQQFLVGKEFSIPAYQRDYAWKSKQAEDLFDDIGEAIETASGHYLGTVVLSKPEGHHTFEVVDGQQRLTTITLVIKALLEEFKKDDEYRIANTFTLIGTGKNLKINFGINDKFVRALFSGDRIRPETAGQRRLDEVYTFVRERAKALKAHGGQSLVKNWLETIKLLEIIQFDAESTGRAIRMFQTVNDRGMPLSMMDKTKALLVFYSNRYLEGKLDDDINCCFGQCFRSYDSLREVATDKDYKINNIARDTFSEDDILRYHYLAYSCKDASHIDDYEGTSKFVFENFLKGSLKSLAAHPDKLYAFIEDYIDDLSSFTKAFKDLVHRCKSDARLYKSFVIHGLAARLYPLTIRLYQREMLFSSVHNQNIDLFGCIEICDLRVYKTRGTDPAKDIGNLSHASRVASAVEIANGLRVFVSNFMSDGNFKSSLELNMYQNRALLYFLLSFDQDLAGKEYSLDELMHFQKNEITREHIISQTPTSKVTSLGFMDEEDFNEYKNSFGNLTLLSKGENSSLKNTDVNLKMSDTLCYSSSMYAGPRILAQEVAVKGGAFNKKELIARTGFLSSWCVKEWSIWDSIELHNAE